MSHPRIVDWSDLGRRIPEEDRWLFRHFSDGIVAGEKVMVEGPSGSGKTIFLRCLSLLDRPDEGDIRWRGEKVTAEMVPAFRKNVSYVHQRPALIPGTVEVNLSATSRLRENGKRPFDRDAAVKLLGKVNREERFLQRRRGELSGGEEQFVGLIRTLLNEPDLLLLDEPTASLDARSTGIVENLLLEWIEEKPQERALCWVTHDSDQASRLATRLYRFDPESDQVTTSEQLV